MFETIETYQDLYDVLQNMTSEQRQKPVQSVKSHPVSDWVYPLEQVICIATVDELELKYARSSVDNRRHGDDIVLFSDGNPFSESGAVALEISYDKETKERHSRSIYSKDHNDACDWSGPAQRLEDAKNISTTVSNKDFLIGKRELAILKSRIKDPIPDVTEE